jgi:hypothetical protein
LILDAGRDSDGALQHAVTTPLAYLQRLESNVPRALDSWKVSSTRLDERTRRRDLKPTTDEPKTIEHNVSLVR